MYITTGLGETIELTDSIRWDIKEIQRKEPKSLEITEEETKEKVQKFKNNIIDYLKVNVQEFPKELEQVYRPLIPCNQDMYLSKKYFEILIGIQEVQNQLERKYIYCLKSLKDSIPNNQSYIYNVFLPCKLFLEREYKRQYQKLNKLYDFYDRKSSQLLISSSQMQGEKQYGFSIVKEVLKIEQKYNILRECIESKNNLKHLKITGDKIDYLILDELFNITTNVYGLVDKKRIIIEKFADIHVHKSSFINLNKIKKLLDMLEGISKIINSKYDSIIKNKKFTNKIVYFSNLEQLTIFEICELLKEFCNIINLIKEEFEKISKDKEYLNNEFHLNSDNEEDVYNVLFCENDTIVELYSYGLSDEENLRNYLPWIFGPDTMEQPDYNL